VACDIKVVATWRPVRIGEQFGLAREAGAYSRGYAGLADSGEGGETSEAYLCPQ